MAAARLGDNFLKKESARTAMEIPHITHARLDGGGNDKKSDTNPTAPYYHKRSEAMMRVRKNRSTNDAVSLETRRVIGGLASTRFVTANRCGRGARATGVNAILETARAEAASRC